MTAKPALKRVFIEVTTRCNLKCPLCPTGRGELSSRDMTLEMFRSIVDQLPLTCTEVGLFNFGESLLHRDIVAMISYVTKRGLESFISTNMNVGRSIVRGIARSGLCELIVSVDGLSEQTYSYYRVGGMLAKVVLNIEAFLLERAKITSAPGPLLTLQFLENQRNSHEVGRFWEFARESGADKAVVKSLNSRNYSDAGEYLSTRFSRYMEAIPKPLDVCPWPWDGCVVRVDGMVQACCASVVEPSLTMGDLHCAALEEIWHSNTYELLRHRMAMGRGCLQFCDRCTSASLYPGFAYQVREFGTRSDA